MALPNLFQDDDADGPQSIEDHVDTGIENLNIKIQEAEQHGEDVLASVHRVLGAITLLKLRNNHRNNRSVGTTVDRWVRSELPKAESDHVKRALNGSVDGSATDQPGETADQDLDADDDNEVVAQEVPPTRHLEDLIGEDLLARLYTRVVSQIMAAYEIEADIPVYEQENDNPGSYLFTGEPGTGKTHAAEGVAFVLRDLGYDVGFYPVLGSQIKQSEYGESEDRLRRLLRRADDDGHELSVVFFDEFEDIATRNEHHATAAIANTLQSLTSGADVVDSVVVIGATNHSEQISDAIHNRFTDVEFQEPSREAKVEMLEHYLGEACDFDSKRLVSLDNDLFDGLTGRDIKLAARDAADHSLLPTESSRPTSVSEMETVREQLQQTPNVSIDDVRLALANRH
jgi:ATPases of the AAA+ class